MGASTQDTEEIEHTKEATADHMLKVGGRSSKKLPLSKTLEAFWISTGLSTSSQGMSPTMAQLWYSGHVTDDFEAKEAEF